MKEKCERGAMFITHWDNGTFTTIRDSAVLRIVDNDLDWKTKTIKAVIADEGMREFESVLNWARYAQIPLCNL